MKTITLSPRRRLEAELGIGKESHGKRNGDSIRCQGEPLSCGDHVVDMGDERHVGEVRMISANVHVTVRWLETGHKSVVNIKHLRKVTK